MSRRPGFDDVRIAAERLKGLTWHTPLNYSAWLSDATGAQVWLKLDCVQPTGSFKVRGAFNALVRLRAEQPKVTTVVTASAGNHGLAMATAAARLGLNVRIHMPSTAPRAKRDALAKLGASVVEAPTYDEAEAGVRDEVSRTGAVFVSAYSHPDVIAGAGTAALEMIDDEPALDTLVVPLGGGGLLSGTAIVARARMPEALVIGAEADASPVFTAALAAGHPVTVPIGPTLADGLAGNMEPDSQTFDIVRDLVDRVVRVPESQISDAMRAMIRHERLIIEGAAAAAIGALIGGELPLAGRRVGVIVTGRNVDV